MSDDDNRQHPRFPSSLETIYFTESSNLKGEDRMYYPGTITDQSAHGIGLRVSFQHSPNDLIWLEGLTGLVGLEALEKPRSAHVRWVNSHGMNSDEFNMGIEFVVADETLQ